LSELVKIGSLTPRSRGVNLVAKVVEKPEPRVVSSQYDQSEHRLTEALIADETGAITLVLWDDNINMVSEGDSIKVTNGFVKLFKGRMQLNLGKVRQGGTVRRRRPRCKHREQPIPKGRLSARGKRERRF
jgi:replication factor A1